MCRCLHTIVIMNYWITVYMWCLIVLYIFIVSVQQLVDLYVTFCHHKLFCGYSYVKSCQMLVNLSIFMMMIVENLVENHLQFLFLKRGKNKIKAEFLSFLK